MSATGRKDPSNSTVLRKAEILSSEENRKIAKKKITMHPNPSFIIYPFDSV